jgi:hypothetical protein
MLGLIRQVHQGRQEAPVCRCHSLAATIINAVGGCPASPRATLRTEQCLEWNDESRDHVRTPVTRGAIRCAAFAKSAGRSGFSVPRDNVVKGLVKQVLRLLVVGHPSALLERWRIGLVTSGRRWPAAVAKTSSASIAPNSPRRATSSLHPGQPSRKIEYGRRQRID